MSDGPVTLASVVGPLQIQPDLSLDALTRKSEGEEAGVSTYLAGHVVAASRPLWCEMSHLARPAGMRESRHQLAS